MKPHYRWTLCRHWHVSISRRRHGQNLYAHLLLFQDARTINGSSLIDQTVKLGHAGEQRCTVRWNTEPSSHRSNAFSIDVQRTKKVWTFCQHLTVSVSDRNKHRLARIQVGVGTIGRLFTSKVFRLSVAA